MDRKIAQLSLIVRDYDEAIAFYVSRLGFVLIEDTRLSETKRWVVVAPSADAAGSASSAGCKLLLAKAADAEQMRYAGNQTGGRVFLFLHTDDIARDHARLVAEGVTVVREPAVMPYGTVLVFADLYGNLWDLIEPKR
ncbi:VOC family protein [Puia sp.]|jgi:catechol 2,3-dioxygenase-like lactoylglutathione lyase family enzyme|uniref:VOC family protein n=1 Tax=Puia sp. TaxID=2045100 RepID=UPI002F3F8205